MAKARKLTPKKTSVTAYQFTDHTRKNIPPAGLAAQGKVQNQPKIKYSYDPHLAPVLRFDETGKEDDLYELLLKSQTRPLKPDEAKRLQSAIQHRQPWLEWAGKREKDFFGVDPVALHIHERVSAQAILRTAKREEAQRDLFADPQLDYAQATQFYQHDVEWSNRLILGDSLQVMASLARREGLAGKVQMIYIDPPYGIKFSSNWQNEVGKRDVKDKDDDLTREPEMIKAYRDTWTLGVHSYLDYLKQRLIVARELLTDSGSVFVQISDENLHRVRMVMDEIFGPDNFCSAIAFRTTTGKGATLLDSTADFLLWYARDKSQVRFNKIFINRSPLDDDNLRWLKAPTGYVRRMTDEEAIAPELIPKGWLVFRPNPITSQSASNAIYGYSTKAFQRSAW
ncbi:MAG: DNA methyltransferase [Gammaproteobacteria bacterium]